MIVVQPGDTLWSLAGRHLGDPLRWTALFAANEQAIVAEQKRRGVQTWEPENWIFPGTELRLPTHDRITEAPAR